MFKSFHGCRNLWMRRRQRLEKISEETFGNSMIYVMPYIYMEGRIRKDGSVLFYVFSASGALKHHEDDWDID